MNNELLEKLAALEHEQWEEWSKAVAPEVDEERRLRWEAYWVPYGQLDEKTKDMDREWATEVMEIIEPYLKGDEIPGDEPVGEVGEEEIEDLPPMEEIEILDEEPEDIKAQSQRAKEMVMKVNVDANKYPNVAQFMQTIRAESMEFPEVDEMLSEGSEKAEGHCYATWMEGLKKLEEAQVIFNQAMGMSASEELPLEMKSQLSDLVASLYGMQTQIEATLNELQEVDEGAPAPVEEPEEGPAEEEPSAE